MHTRAMLLSPPPAPPLVAKRVRVLWAGTARAGTAGGRKVSTSVDPDVRAADLLVTPSAMESFSLVVLEAWAARTPVLVNRWCGATHDHARSSRGGLWYGDYPQFEASLDRLLTDPDLRAALAANGAAFGAATYGWDAIVQRFEAFCHGAVRRAGHR